MIAHPVVWFVDLWLSGLILPQYLGRSAITRGAGVSLFPGFWGVVLAGWLTATLGCLGAVLLVAVHTRSP